jgi:hypothetical protein
MSFSSTPASPQLQPGAFAVTGVLAEVQMPHLVKAFPAPQASTKHRHDTRSRSTSASLLLFSKKLHFGALRSSVAEAQRLLLYLLGNHGEIVASSN